MAAVTWDEPGSRVYESGLDRAVLIFPEGGGVAWNGLTGIDESPEVSVEPYYYDGTKFEDFVTVGNFSATLRAYTYPDEFQLYQGVIEDQSGFFIANQAPRRFHLTYRTMIGDDNDPVAGYKIHILYNITAVPQPRSNVTLANGSAPIEFEWALTAIPEELPGYNSTAHVIIDSRTIDPWLLEDIEVILYGDETHIPTAPALSGFAAFIRNWERLIIVDHNDGTWTATTPRDGIITMLDATTFQIDDANATYLDATTYEITSSEKNEEDIWLP